MIPVPFQFSGGTGGHRSTQFSSELTRCVYIDKAENGRIGSHDFPGLKAWGTAGGSDRGFHVMANVLYKICGTTLYSISSGGVYTSRGSVPGTDRAIFADDGSNLFIVAGGSLYQWDGASITNVTPSIVGAVLWIAYINRQFLIGGANGLFASSNVADGSTYNALNYAEAEVGPDELIRGYVFNQLVYMLGEETTEPWYNSGVGNPPFDRQDTALVNIGIAGKYAVDNTDQYLYWLGNDRKFYQCVGASARPVSTVAFAHAVEAMGTVSDCIVSTCVFEGQDFVFVTFPTESRTFFYSETYNYWGELCSGTADPGDRWYGNAVISCYGKRLVSDYRNGNVYELDGDTFTDNGDARLRIRVLPAITGDMAGLPGRQITVCSIRLNMQRGVGLATGQGSDPELMCQLSNDGGHTYAAEEFVSMGVMGDYVTPIDFNQFSTGYEIRAKIKCSDPVFLSIWDGIAYVVDAGY